MAEQNTGNAGGGAEKKPDGETYDVIEPSLPPRPAPVINAPKLLSEFDEDADFDHDPAVKAAQGKVKIGPPLIVGEDDEDAFVKPGLGDERVWAIAGVVLMVGAIAGVLMHAPNNSAWRAILVVAQCFVHAATGVAAVGATASLSQLPLGKVDLAAARMFAIVAWFQLVFNLSLQVSTTKIDEIVVAGLVYLLALRVLFRRPNDQTVIIAGFHFLGWLAVFLLGQLYAMANQPGPVTAGGG